MGANEKQNTYNNVTEEEINIVNDSLLISNSNLAKDSILAIEPSTQIDSLTNLQSDMTNDSLIIDKQDIISTTNNSHNRYFGHSNTLTLRVARHYVAVNVDGYDLSLRCVIITP